MDSSTLLRTEVGTAHYRAPEVADREYTCTVDCWSVGCIVYRLIARKGLFKSLSDVYTFKFTGAPSPVSSLINLGLCGDDCADFVGKLITADPNVRLDAAAALGHPWMLRLSGTDQNGKYTISTKLRTRFESYKALSMIANSKGREL